MLGNAAAGDLGATEGDEFVIHLRNCLLWTIVVGFLVWGSAANAAPPLPLDLDDSRSALAIGEELERSAKWLDAVQHYDGALKRWPNDDDLKYGKRRAKAHFKIDRRYADKSFQSSLLVIPEAEALDLYDELLAQVRRNFVDPLSYLTVVAHGTESFYIALANPKFLENNLPPARSEADREARKDNVKQLRTVLRERFWNRPVQDRDQARQLVREVCAHARQTTGMQSQAVVMEYLFGGCNALDDYSGFLTADRFQDLNSNINGEFVGIGVEMKAIEAEGMLLVNVLPESPASTGGLKRGDHIQAIDGVDVRNATIDDAAQRLRGEIGSRVKLKIARASKVWDAVLIRREVQVKSIPEMKIVDRDNGIGYIKLIGFQKSTAQEFETAMRSLEAQGMRALILDVRGNPGGLLTAAVELLDRLIDNNGVLVSTRGRSTDQNWTYRSQQNGASSVPLVLLTDGDSASASEIVAGAIKDHHRGTIVGRKTYGKWSVQSIFHVGRATGLRLTTARFYSPNGHTYGQVGIEPDVLVEVADERLSRFRSSAQEDADDADMTRALQVLKSQVSSRR